MPVIPPPPMRTAVTVLLPPMMRVARPTPRSPVRDRLVLFSVVIGVGVPMLLLASACTVKSVAESEPPVKV